jgi:hypothetical protein
VVVFGPVISNQNQQPVLPRNARQPVGLAYSVPWLDVRVCARRCFRRLSGSGVMSASLVYLLLRQVLQMLT